MKFYDPYAIKKKKEPKDGIEPSTFRLQGECSATKLFGLILELFNEITN